MIYIKRYKAVKNEDGWGILRDCGFVDKELSYPDRKAAMEVAEVLNFHDRYY